MLACLPTAVAARPSPARLLCAHGLVGGPHMLTCLPTAAAAKPFSPSPAQPPPPSRRTAPLLRAVGGGSSLHAAPLRHPSPARRGWRGSPSSPSPSMGLLHLRRPPDLLATGPPPNSGEQRPLPVCSPLAPVSSIAANSTVATEAPLLSLCFLFRRTCFWRISPEAPLQRLSLLQPSSVIVVVPPTLL